MVKKLLYYYYYYYNNKVNYITTYKQRSRLTFQGVKAGRCYLVMHVCKSETESTIIHYFKIFLQQVYQMYGRVIYCYSTLFYRPHIIVPLSLCLLPRRFAVRLCIFNQRVKPFEILQGELLGAWVGYQVLGQRSG